VPGTEDRFWYVRPYIDVTVRRFLVLVFASLVAGALAIVTFRRAVFGHAAPGASSAARHPPSDTPHSAGTAELAFVAPLAPGKALLGWTVRGISAVYHGSIQVELARGN